MCCILKENKTSGAMLWIPMFFMMAVTFTALGMTTYRLCGQLFTVGLTFGIDITVNLCSIVIMSWCNCSNPGCEKAFEKTNKQ